MSYNISDPNRLPTTLPITELGFVMGNTVTETTGQLVFSPLDTSHASGQYQFLTSNASGDLSLQNLNITAENGVQLSSNIDANHISTIISLPDQDLKSQSAEMVFSVEIFLPDDPVPIVYGGSLTIGITDQGIISTFIFVPFVGALEARRTPAEDRIAQIEERIRALEVKVLG